MLKEDIEKHIGKKVKIRVYERGSILEGVPLKGILEYAPEQAKTTFWGEILRKRTEVYYMIRADEGSFFFNYEKNGETHKIDRVCFQKEDILEIEPVNENDADYQSER